MGKNKNNHKKRNGTSFLKKYSLPILAGALAPVFGAWAESGTDYTDERLVQLSPTRSTTETITVSAGIQRFAFNLIRSFSGYNYITQDWSFNNLKSSGYPIGATALFTYAISDKGLGIQNKLNANLPFKL